MSNERHLRLATRALPVAIAEPMRVALEQGELRIGAFSYETELAVCPIAAAAQVAGVWHGGCPQLAGPPWGTEERPSPAVEEFAAWFDICAEEGGLEHAIAIVSTVLRRRAGDGTRAAVCSPSSCGRRRRLVRKLSDQQLRLD